MSIRLPRPWFGLLGLVVFLAGCGDSVLTPATTPQEDPVWSRPLPQAVSAKAVWASASDQVFVLGVNGHLSRYDGTRWVMRTPPVLFGMRGIWGSAPDNVFAVGFRGKIYRFDGATYREVASGTQTPLNGVFGLGANDVTVVGDDGLILHFDGAAWRAQPSGTERDLKAITAANGHWFVVGQGGVVLHKAPGKGWVTLRDPGGSALQGVWAESESFVVAVGDNGTAIRYDGSAWSAFAGGPSGDLTSVSGTAGNDVWAVGKDGAFRWDGSSWTLEQDERVIGAWGLPDGDLVLVTGAKAQIRSGGVWTTSDTGLDFAGTRTMTGFGDDDYVVFGSAGVGLRYEGGVWVVLKDVPISVRTSWADPGTGDIYLVGWPGPSGPYGDSVIRLRDDVFTVLYTAAGRSLSSVWGVGNDVFAAGEDGLIVHSNGAVWSEVQVPVSSTNPYIHAIEGTAPDDVYAVARDRVYHFDGTDWTRIGSWDSDWFLNEIGVRGVNDVFVLGTKDLPGRNYSNHALHFDGTEWTTYLSAGSIESQAEIAFGPDGTGYIVGYAFGSTPNGVIYRISEAGWVRRVEGPETGGFEGLWISASGSIRAWGSGIWKRRADAPW